MDAMLAEQGPFGYTLGFACCCEVKQKDFEVSSVPRGAQRLFWGGLCLMEVRDSTFQTGLSQSRASGLRAAFQTQS